MSAALVMFRAGEAAGQPPSIVIYDGKYPGWPWVAVRADGSLVCVFREGTVHDYSESGKVMFTRSTDEGRTWSPAETIVDVPSVDDRNAAIVELPDRSLLVTYNSYTAKRESEAMAVRSADGGKTWSAPGSVGIANTRTRAAAVVLADASLLLPLYIAPGNGAIAARSVDNGCSWQAARVPDTEGFVGDEWDVLEADPGRLIGILRNSHTRSDGTFWKTESKDGGRTWSIPRPTNARSERYPSPPQITRHGRTPILVYADRRMVSVSMARTSDPDFLKWDVARRMPCYLYTGDGSPILDASYPVSVPLDRTRRLIVDYEIRPDSRRITAHFVEMPADWR
jgi:Neuraminidase (sialidase)